MRKRSALCGSLTMAAVAVLVACGDSPSPTGPSAFSPSSSAEVAVQGGVQGKGRVGSPQLPTPRKPLIPTPTPTPLPKAVVSGELAVKYLGSPGPDKFEYLFDIKLTESAGVSATITVVSMSFDGGWGAWCSWGAEQFWQPNLAAKGTLALEPLTCTNWWASTETEVSVSLKDANGYVTTIYMWHPFRPQP